MIVRLLPSAKRIEIDDDQGVSLAVVLLGNLTDAKLLQLHARELGTAAVITANMSLLLRDKPRLGWDDRVKLSEEVEQHIITFYQKIYWV